MNKIKKQKTKHGPNNFTFFSFFFFLNINFFFYYMLYIDDFNLSKYYLILSDWWKKYINNKMRKKKIYFWNFYGFSPCFFMFQIKELRDWILKKEKLNNLTFFLLYSF